MYVPFDHFSPTIGQIKDPLLSERLRFFREKSLKVNFDGTRIWEIFSIERILKRAEEMIIQWSELYGGCDKTSRENSNSFLRVREDVAVIMMEGSGCFCWTTSFKRSNCSQYLAVSMVSLRATHNKQFPQYPTRYTASFSSGEVRL